MGCNCKNKLNNKIDNLEKISNRIFIVFLIIIGIIIYSFL